MFVCVRVSARFINDYLVRSGPSDLVGACDPWVLSRRGAEERRALGDAYGVSSAEERISLVVM